MITSNAVTLTVVAAPVVVPPPTGNKYAMDEANITPYAWVPGAPWGRNEGANVYPPGNGHNGAWRDAAGVAYGDAAYASAPIGYFNMWQTPPPNVPVVWEVPITSLVNEWRTNGNRGLMIRSNSASQALFSHNATTYTQWHPKLVVTLAGGAVVECACTADTSLDRATPQALGLETPYHHIAGAEQEVYRYAAQFDLSPITGPVASAKLVLYFAVSDSPATLSVFLLDPPVT